MIQFNQSNNPNAARLIDSLRHVGYNNYEAIADIIDNSFDADADHITFQISKVKDDFRIVITDDGCGMDGLTVDEALRLGSLTERDPATDLGRFGMGLVTASLSLSRRTHVITKQAGKYWTSIVDVDEIRQRNDFCKHLALAGPDDRALFDRTLGDVESGTVVILTKTDLLKNRNTTQFANIARKHLGEVHRNFIMAGKKIVVNGEVAPALDPLMWDHPETERFSDDEYPIEIRIDGEKTTENVRVRIALIPENLAEGELAFSKGLMHQGFYGLRNQREIFRAQTLDLFTKHNDFNRMRGEIFFSGKFDELIGIEFTKRQIVFDQAIHDKLKDHLKGQCTTIKRREAGRNVQRVSKEQEQLHEQASKAITEKSRLLITPKGRIEKRAPGERTGTVKPTGSGAQRRNLRKTQVAPSVGCRFVAQRLGPNGQIFECDLEGRTVVIRWNIEHPFYRRFVADNLNDGRLVTAADFLVYSMACAELRERDEANVEFINNMKSVISSNLRTLLS